MKIEWMWRSTARVVIPSCSAIPGLLQPSATRREDLLLAGSQLIEAGILALSVGLLPTDRRSASR